MIFKEKLCFEKGSLLIIAFFCFITQSVSGLDRYWIANTSSNWNTAANWSAASGGTGGASVPAVGDNVFFDANGTGNCSLPSAAVTITAITVGAGYSGTISLGTFAFVVSGPTVFNGGNFTGGSGPITFSNGFTLAGTNFTSTSGTLLITTRDISFTAGVFNHNNGTVRFEQNGSNLSLTGNFVFNNLEIAGPYTTTTINSNIQINGNLFFDTNGPTESLTVDATLPGIVVTVNGNVVVSSGSGAFVLNNFTLKIKGNFTQNHTCACGGGSAVLEFIGTGDQTLSSSVAAYQGYLPSITINKTSGNFILSGILTVTGTDWKLLAGVMIPSTSTIIFYGYDYTNRTILGDQTFNNLTIDSNSTITTISDDLIVSGNFTIDCTMADNTLNINGSITANGTLTVNGTGSYYLNTGTVYARGNIFISNTGNGDGGTGTFKIDGSSNQYFDGGTLVGFGALPAIIINKPSGVLTLGPNTITYVGVWNYVSGIIDASTNSSTVYFYSGNSTTINAPASSMSFHNFIIDCPFRSLVLQANIDFNGSLTILADSNLDPSISNYSINVGGNFTSNTGGTFTARNGTVTFDGTSNQTYSTTSNFTFYKVVMNKPSGALILSRRLFIGNSLTLTSGIITTTSTNFLRMTNGSTCNVGNSASYVNGPMEYVMSAVTTRTLNLPVGKSGSWRPAVLTVTHTAAAGSITYTAELIGISANSLGYTKDATMDRVSGARYWQIDRSSSAGLTSARVQLFYDNEGVDDFANLTVAKTNGAGTNWFDVGGVATGNTTGSILSSPFTTFSKFALGNKTGFANPLPIKLASFTGKYFSITNEVILNWQTLSEINNDYFIVERMADDNQSFVKLGEIRSLAINGQSASKLDYTYNYKNPIPGRGYYRLKQIDFDGASTYSELISVDVTAGFVISPNPCSTRKIQIHLPSVNESPYILTITDLSGVAIFNEEILHSRYGGPVNISLNENLAEGFYVVKVQSRGQVLFTTRLIVL
jgi:hypothetical protein